MNRLRAEPEDEDCPQKNIRGTCVAINYLPQLVSLSVWTMNIHT